MKKIVFLAFVLWLLSMSMFCTRPVVRVNGLPPYDVSPGQSIQEAINLAESGDIIFVHAGTYLERVVVNKTVSLMGEDKQNTIIYWNDTGSVVHVTADNAVITNFTLILASEASAYPDSGIFLDDSDNNNISNNIVYGNGTTNNGNGILLYKSSNNNISGNTITNNERGIYLYDASGNNIISGNDITNNGNGIYIYSSSGNIIYHNNFINNAKHVDDFGLGHKPRLSVNYWDDGYPSGGNYWDDYLTRYPDAKERDGSGIGDTPYVIYEKNQDNYPLLPPWFPPTVFIVSPENKTYAVADVPLVFTVSEATSWMGYSLDGQTNVTVSGNTTLADLSDGIHTITVYANDTAGNTGHSDTIYFTIDTMAPNIQILSPENKTYTTNSVSLSFTVNETTSWIGYSLDGQANKTITGDTTLSGLSDGSHSLIVYASDMLGNTGSSVTVYFTVDTTLPSIIILSPENKTYAENVVQLSFTVDEQATWMAYSLDGKANATITGNTTLTSLVDGTHYVVVYAKDTAGNIGASDTVYFTVDTEAPIIMILSPENKTYAVNNVSLTFTVTETTLWVGYSLDGQANVTVSGNTTILGLSDGVHSITVYATDIAGNRGSSDTVYFTIDTVLPLVEVLSPKNKTYAVADVPLVFTVSEATAWMGYSLDGQTNVTVVDNTTLVGLSEGVHTITVYAADTAGNMGSSVTVYFAVDTTLPSIIILSPENKTYAENVVQLSFTVDKAVLWLGYSLDGQANITITGNSTLESLVDGVHYVVVYASNTAGKMGESDTVFFTVDTEAPIIIILSPKNETYASTSFSLNFTRSEPTSWMGYSLDGQMNVTVGGNITLVGLSEGIHSITVYATDIAGNVGSSDVVYFTVDTVSVSIDLLSPENKTYAVADVPLSFTVSEAPSWMGYSLDGQMNVTVSGNITLVGLSDGVHTITVYADDAGGNGGLSDTVYFTVNALLPNIELFSPENKTYTTNSVSLNFSVSEPTLWKGYSLDGQANVTIFGDITLAGLSEGSHSLVVYVKDMAGNAVASETVYFAVETRQTGPSQLWVVAVIAVIAGVGFVLSGYMAYDFFKRRQK